MEIILPGGTVHEVRIGAAPVREVLEYAGLHPFAYLVERDGRIIPDDALVGEHDRLPLHPVSHGG